MGLIDVVMAVALLGLVMIPAAYLVVNNQRNVSGLRNQASGQDVAAQQIEVVRQGMTTVTDPTQYGQMDQLTSGTAWPTATKGVSNLWSGPVYYTITTVGGWCMLTNNGGSGLNFGAGSSGSPYITNSTAPVTPPATFMVAVQVTWINQEQKGSTGRYVAYGVVPNQPGWVIPTSLSSQTGLCPSVLS